VKFTPQLAVPDVAPVARVQLGALREPEPVEVQVTVPVGVLTVPGEVSVTVAVHGAATPMTKGPVHATDVEVERRLTVRFVGGLVLPLWVVSVEAGV
jgi:hypothetical protein